MRIVSRANDSIPIFDLSSDEVNTAKKYCPCFYSVNANSAEPVLVIRDLYKLIYCGILLLNPIKPVEEKK